MWVWIYYGINFLLVLILGYLQTRVRPSLDGETDERITQMYAIFAITCLIAQGLVSICVLAGTGWFPAAAVVISKLERQQFTCFLGYCINAESLPILPIRTMKP
jgi:hypothetical protein